MSQGAPRALVTNDDGIDAPGLRHLAHAATIAGLEVVVAAPTRESSGSSAAITAIANGGHIAIERRPVSADDDNCPWYAISGSPALIALIATRGVLGRSPDIVLSGINRGANTGNAVMHSGTVGAALTAAVAGCRAVAISLDLRRRPPIRDMDSEPQRHWDTAATVVGRILPEIMQLPPAVVLNINVPDLPLQKIKGLRSASLGGFGRVQITQLEKDSGLVRISLGDPADQPAPGSDLALLADDYVTATALNPLCEVHPRLDLDRLIRTFDKTAREVRQHRRAVPG